MGQTVSGWAIIQSGLKDDDQVIIDGLQRARPGLKVVPTSQQLTVDADALLRGRGQPDSTPANSDAVTQPAEEAVNEGTPVQDSETKPSPSAP